MFGCKPMRAHFNVTFLAERKGPVPSAQEAITLAEHDFSSCPKLDILVVPGTHAPDSPCYLVNMPEANNNKRLDNVLTVHWKSTEMLQYKCVARYKLRYREFCISGLAVC